MIRESYRLMQILFIGLITWLMLAGTSMAQSTNLVLLQWWKAWDAVPATTGTDAGACGEYRYVFVSNSCVASRSGQEKLYVSSTNTAIVQAGADDEIDVKVQGTNNVVVFVGSSPHIQDITSYTRTGTNNLHFEAWNNQWTEYCSDPVYLLLYGVRENGQGFIVKKETSTTEPIDLTTGNTYFKETDFEIPCPGFSLSMMRQYNSTRNYYGTLGSNWSHVFECRLFDTNTLYETATNDWKVLHMGDGQEFWFKYSNSVYLSPMQNNWQLQQIDSQYRVTMPGGVSYAFDNNGTLTSISNLWGNSLTFTYTNSYPSNLLSRVDHNNGKYLIFSYQSNLLTSITTPTNALSISLSYDFSHRQLTNRMLSASSSNFNNSYSWQENCLTQKVSAAGTIFKYGYLMDGSGIGTNVEVDAYYYKHTAIYDISSGVATVIYRRDGNNQVYKYCYYPESKMHYEISGPAATTNGTAPKHKFRYDSNWNVTNETLETETTNEWSTLYQLWDNYHNVTNVGFAYCSAPANFWKYTWNTNWQVLTSITDPEGSKMGFDYTNASVSRIKAYYDASSSYDTLISYTTNGFVSGITNANGHWEQYSYDNSGNLTSAVSQAGLTNFYEYTSLNYLKKIKLLSDCYDDNNNMLLREIIFDVNTLGWVTKTTYTYSTNINAYEYFYYDSVGNVTNHIDIGGRSTFYTYLPTHKLESITRYIGTTNITTTFSYDSQFNVLSITDPNNRAVETYQLDLQDRITSVMNLEGQMMYISYGLGDYVKSVTRYDGSVVSNDFNSDGLISMTHMPDSTNSYTYYKNNLLKTAGNETSVISNYYNFANELIRQDTALTTAGSLPPATIIYSKDPVGNVTNASSTAQNLAMTYDTAERVSSFSASRTALSPLGFNVGYDPVNGKVSTITCTNTGFTVSYSWDYMDRVSWIRWKDASNNVINSFSYGYNSAGMISSCESDEITSYSYDSLDRLIGETKADSFGQTNFAETIEYDKVGNRTTKTRDDVAVDFYYSGYYSDRMMQWRLPYISLLVQMDVYGYANEAISADSHWGELWVSNAFANKLTPSVSGTNFWLYDMGFNVGTQSLVAAIRDDAGNTSFITNTVMLSVVTNNAIEANDAGCITNMSYLGSGGYSKNVSLTWNSKYQLTSVSTNSIECERNGFDAYGRRAWSWDGTETNFFVYDGANLIAEVNATGGLKRAYVYAGLDFPLAVTVYTGATTKTYYYLTDHLGSVHAVADETGAIVEKYRFDAWGRVLGIYNGINQPIRETAIGNRLLWQGREYNWRTGLYYFRNRFYSPIEGRWLSNDPIGIAGGLNQRIFCSDNPVNFRDEFGLDVYYSNQGGGDHAAIIISDSESKSGWYEYSFVPIEGGRGRGLPLLKKLREWYGGVHCKGYLRKFESSPQAKDIKLDVTPKEECEVKKSAEKVYDNPGDYDYFIRNCSTVARSILSDAKFLSVQTKFMIYSPDSVEQEVIERNKLHSFTKGIKMIIKGRK